MINLQKLSPGQQIPVGYISRMASAICELQEAFARVEKSSVGNRNFRLCKIISGKAEIYQTPSGAATRTEVTAEPLLSGSGTLGISEFIGGAEKIHYLKSMPEISAETVRVCIGVKIDGGKLQANYAELTLGIEEDDEAEDFGKLKIIAVEDEEWTEIIGVEECD